ESDFPGIDWSNVGDLVIMSGDPNFSGWSHKTEKGQMDELRIFNKALTQSEIQAVVLKDQAVFSMNFNGYYQDAVSGNDATVVGTPGFDTGVTGDAYKGATDSYLTFPSAGLLSDEFSATFWLKIDASDTR
ncbi:LamG domain-containing protein, partial [Aureibaculum marinum]